MSKSERESVRIVIAEDDDDDYQLTSEALCAHRLINRIDRVHNGEELIDYLRGRGRWMGRAHRPALILLDLNMPRMDGREALAVIKSDPELRHLPVVVLTTSHAEADVSVAYSLGSNSFVSKPMTFPDFAEAIRVLGSYWFEVVELPSPR